MLNVPFFRKALEKNPYPHIAYLWEKYPHCRLNVTDVILSFIGYINRGSIGYLPGLGEAGWGDNIFYAINTDKRWCSMPLEEDEKHLVKIL